MSILNESLRNVIRKEIVKLIEAENFGAFRRLVINTKSADAIKDEINAYMSRPQIKTDYKGMKFKMLPGVKSDTIVVDLEGISATALANKISDIVKKFDKSAAIKVRKEKKLKAA